MKGEGESLPGTGSGGERPATVGLAPGCRGDRPVAPTQEGRVQGRRLPPQVTVEGNLLFRPAGLRGAGALHAQGDPRAEEKGRKIFRPSAGGFYAGRGGYHPRWPQRATWRKAAGEFPAPPTRAGRPARGHSCVRVDAPFAVPPIDGPAHGAVQSPA